MTPGIIFPGIFVEELPPGQAIEGVPTSVTVFIGPTRYGAINCPVKVASFSEFERRFGPLSSALETGYAVRQYFLNCASQAWVVRVARNPDKRRLRAGLKSLDSVDVVNLLVMPGVTSPAAVALAADYCKRRRAFLIVDPPADAKTPEQMEQARQSLTFDSRGHAATYYPWITIADPLRNNQPRLTPPSGAVAGMIARTDGTRGVWKAPAGSEASLKGVAGLERELSEAENGQLTQGGINCLRSLPGQGIVAWGARTLAGDDQGAAELKYVNVRRLGLFIEESVDRGIQWAVFEPNGDRLWAQLRLQTGAFLYQLFRQGAFMGVKPQESYFVKCDRSTMTQSDIDAGVVNIIVGFAPLKPAEFIIIRFQQAAGCKVA